MIFSPGAKAVVKDESDGGDAARSHNSGSTFSKRIVKIEIDFVTTIQQSDLSHHLVTIVVGNVPLKEEKEGGKKGLKELLSPMLELLGKTGKAEARLLHNLTPAGRWV